MNSKRYSDKLYEVREVSDLKDIITQSTSLFADKTAYLVKNQRLGRFVPITYRQVRKDINVRSSLAPLERVAATANVARLPLQTTALSNHR